MLQLKPYQTADFERINYYFPKKEIAKYTNEGKYRMLSLFALYKSKFYLLWENDNIVGCGVIRWKWSRDTKRFGYWLYAIWINPNYRGQGLGVVLMKSLFRELCIQNIKKVFLTVDNTNTIAQNLYKKLGFEEILQNEQYIVMQYDL